MSKLINEIIMSNLLNINIECGAHEYLYMCSVHSFILQI